MAQNASTKARPTRPRNVARRIALMLTILVALSACGGGKGDRVGTAGNAAESAVGEVPKVCQEARKAFSDWHNGALDAEKAAGKMVTDAVWINVEISSNRVSGGGSVKEINGLIAKLNANGKGAQQKVVKAGELYDAFSPLYDACRALKGVNLPTACLDEMRQYPAVTAALMKLAQAQTARLTKVTAVRTAMIARDRRKEAAAGQQEKAATTQLTAALKNWNKTVLPKYDAAVKACNKAIS